MPLPLLQSTLHRGRRLLLAQALTCLTTAVLAQAPNGQPVKIVVPFSAGGVTDQSARLMAERLAPLLGQTVIVENRPGGGGRIGADAVMKAPGDGHTLLMANTSYSVQPVVDPSVKYDPVTALAPVGLVGTYAMAVVVGRHLPVNTLTEYIAHAKRNPGKLTYGSSGMGSGAHFLGEYFKSLTGTFMVHIPYRSTAAALNDVVGGVADMAFDATAKPYADAGKVKVLAVVGTQRDPRMPNVPTVAEAGLPAFTSSSWTGLLAPVSTPPATVARLNKALNTALQDEGLRKSLRDLGLLPSNSQPQDMTEVIRQDVAFHRKVMTTTKLKLE